MASAIENLFVPGTEDIPLMEAITPFDDGNMRFDSPQGRVVESLCFTNLSIQEITQFYDQSLPPLGWIKQENGYLRNGEIFTIESWNENQLTMIRFRLNPQ